MDPGSPRFDIAAKIPQGASENQVPEMVQALLAERFGLAIHRGTANRTIYALLVAKRGQKVKESAQEPVAPVPAEDADAPPGIVGFFGATQDRTILNADGSDSTTTIGGPHMGTVRETGDPFRIQRWEAPSISMQGLADLLDKVAPLSSPVIDRTGLKGRFQLALEVSLRDARPGMVSVFGNAIARGDGNGGGDTERVQRRTAKARTQAGAPQRTDRGPRRGSRGKISDRQLDAEFAVLYQLPRSITPPSTAAAAAHAGHP